MGDLKATAPAIALADIERAESAIRGAIVETPCTLSRTLSAIVGPEIWLKFENLQFTASYKERGALNRLLALNPAEHKRGVIAMSAGNHGQGVAYHAGRLGIPATIVMPETTPTVKAENTRRLGATVILEGKTLEDAATFAVRHGQEHGLLFIHPYDDPLVIAGQGTIALEMLGRAPDLDIVVLPIGGGGLVSGMAVALKALRPKISIIGVEAALYPSMYNSLKHAHLPIGGDTLAEGIAVKRPGQLTEPICSALLDDVMLVSEAEIEHALCLLLNIEKTVVEGAAAAGLAAVIANPARFAERKVGIVLTGGNIDSRLLASVLTRELAREGRLSRLNLDIPDRPGELARVSSAIGSVGANIVEVYHQRIFTDLPARGTELNLVIETRDAAHLETVLGRLKDAGYTVTLKSSGGS